MQVSAKHHLLGRKLTLKQLCNQSFVSLSEQSNMHKILVNSCKRAGFTPNIAVLINDIKCHDKLIEAGIGIGLGRESTQPSVSQNVCYLDITDFDERYAVYGYFKKHAAYGNVKHFLDFLKNKAGR